MATIKERYELLNGKEKKAMRDNFIKHFGGARNRFYRTMVAPRIELKHLAFFAGSFGVSLEELVLGKEEPENNSALAEEVGLC